jgi:hypothetical protein
VKSEEITKILENLSPAIDQIADANAKTIINELVQFSVEIFQSGGFNKRVSEKVCK